MLNVRRESITQELGELKGAGLIHCQRGRITVVNRPKLEARACECYGGIKREFNRLLAGLANSPVRNGLEEIWQARSTSATPQVSFGVNQDYVSAPGPYVRQEEEYLGRHLPA